ncbi:MAG: hypothetical protein AAF492_12620 [Verrucomicrobiota bacterium]
MKEEALQRLNNFVFSEGKLLSFSSSGRSVTLRYQDYHERIFDLTFVNVAFLQSYGGGASFCEAVITDDSNDIVEAVSMLKADNETSEQWNADDLILLAIFEDVPVFKVIFQDVIINELRQEGAPG